MPPRDVSRLDAGSAVGERAPAARPAEVGPAAPRRALWRRAQTPARRLASVLLFLVLWEIVGRFFTEALFLPPFSAVLVRLATMAWTGELARHINPSIVRVMAGFGLSVAVGIPLGLLMGWFQKWEDFWSFLISFTYPVPKIGLIPLFILWLGIGNLSKVMVIFVAAVFPLVINTFAGVRGVPKIYLWSALTFGATTRELVLRVVLPAALPHILIGVRLAMGISWILLFAAEMVAANTGLGHLILIAQQMFDTDKVFAALITISLLGFVFDRLIHYASLKSCRWYFREAGGY